MGPRWRELGSGFTQPLADISKRMQDESALPHHDILSEREAVAVGDGVDDDAGVRVVG